MRILTPARVTLLMLMIVGGLVAAYVAKGLMASDDTPPEIETRAVPMAVSDLQPGTVVTEAHLGLGRMPVDELNEHPGMLLENRAIVGRVVKQPIQAGTPILSGQLYQPGEMPPLQVGQGMRAVSVSLQDSVSLVDGRIQPGQYVDVHLTPNVDRGNTDRLQGGMTLTLFQGVRVLALSSGDAAAPGGRSGNSVTLELSPGQANIMILAARRGDITLSFNPEGPGQGGVGVNRDDRATLEEILGLTEPKDSTFETENFKGSARSTLRFRNGQRVEDADVTQNRTRKQQPSRKPAPKSGPNVPKKDAGPRRIADGPRLFPSA